MADLIKLQKELETVRKTEAALAAKIKAAQDAKYKALPASVGLSTVDALIKALVPYASPRTKALFTGGSPIASSSPNAVPVKPAARRKRAKITNETRAQLKKLVQSGKTGAEIAKTLGISLPSVQNIKKDLGLVKAR
ncbi:MAG: helix-turn-helix domain-containing protein [Nibricoccus sp.]